MKRCSPLLAILFVTACGKVELAPNGMGGSGAIGQVRAETVAAALTPELKDRVVKLCEQLETADQSMRNAYLGRTFNFRTSRSSCGGSDLGATTASTILALQSDKLVFAGSGLSSQAETHTEGRMAILCKALATLKAPHKAGNTALYYSVVPCPSNGMLTCVTIETGVKNQSGGYLIEQVDEYAVENNASAGGLLGQVRSHRRAIQGSCQVTGEYESVVVDLTQVL
jgi:hypothetical protein